MKLGKFVYQSTLLEVTYLSWHQLTSAENVLSSSHLAHSFRVNTIISDPSGDLKRLQKQVSRQFANRSWVRRRCESTQERVVNGLQAIDTSLPFHDQITAWLFPTGVTTHVLLVAALRNPTVRLRYLAAREVLLEDGHAVLYPELLHLLGCTHLTRHMVEHHLNELEQTFDSAARVAKNSFFFSSNITRVARPMLLKGAGSLSGQVATAKPFF
jgi:hypothetical protein